MKFSERYGYTPINKVIQIDGLNDALRNSIWNVLDATVFSDKYFLKHRYNDYGVVAEKARIYKFSQRLWADFFKLPVDSRDGFPEGILRDIRNWYFNADWFRVYDFLEFFVSLYPEAIEKLNVALERELAGYRIIDGHVTPIIDATEVSSIEKALSDDDFPQVAQHLKTALDHLSRKTTPDYRNSIKESISAVESIAKELTNNKKAMLPEVLKHLEASRGLHPALKEGFIKLYGYTSDADGIRHALTDTENLTQADAIYFLVSCSAFINYLKTYKS